MADLWDESKTEAPTQHRRDEARAQGQVASSADFASSLVLLAGLAVLALTASPVARGLLDSVRAALAQAGQCKELGPDQAQGLLAAVFGKAVELLGVLLALVFLVA